MTTHVLEFELKKKTYKIVVFPTADIGDKKAAWSKNQEILTKFQSFAFDIFRIHARSS